MKIIRNNKSILNKLIAILLSLNVSYIASYKIFLNGTEFGRNFGYLSFIVFLIVFYFLFNRGIQFFVRLTNLLTNKFTNEQISEGDILHKILLIPTIMYSIIIAILFFITTKFVYITWTYGSTTLAEEKVILQTNIKFMVVWLIITSILLIILQIWILMKNRIMFYKTFIISLISTFSIILFFYILTKILQVVLLVLMLFLSILIFGVVG